MVHGSIKKDHLTGDLAPDCAGAMSAVFLAHHTLTESRQVEFICTQGARSLWHINGETRV